MYELLTAGTSRRRFLSLAGATASATLFEATVRGPSAAAESAAVGLKRRPQLAGLAVSVGKADITAPVATPLAGYGVDVPRLSGGSHAPLYARCTVLWDGGSPNVVVTADTLGFGREVGQRIRTRVAALGVAQSDFILAAQHTHNGGALADELVPYIAYNVAANSAPSKAIQSYTSSLEDAIVALVDATLDGPPAECTLDYQFAGANFAFNREGLPYVERDVPILAARRAVDGVLLAVLFSYGCHPVAAGSQKLSDPDYPGVACALIEGATNAHAQFLPGPA